MEKKDLNTENTEGKEIHRERQILIKKKTKDFFRA